MVGTISLVALEAPAEAAFTTAAQQLGVQSVQQASESGDTHVSIGMIDPETGALDQRQFEWSSETIAASAVNQQTTITSSGITVADHSYCRVASTVAVYASVGEDPNALTDTNRMYIPAGTVERFVVCGGWKAAVVAA